MGLDKDFRSCSCAHKLMLDVSGIGYYTRLTVKWRGASPFEFWQKW